MVKARKETKSSNIKERKIQKRNSKNAKYRTIILKKKKR